MKIAVIDDEYYQLTKIKNSLLTQFPEADIACFSNLKEYDNTMEHYDLLLLDVELHKENGIQYIRTHPQKFTYVIYVSAYTENMIDAFDINVIGFIPKEELETRLPEKIKWAEKKLGYLKAYKFSAKEGIIEVKENQILYFQIAYATVSMQLENQQDKISLNQRSLSGIKEVLSDDFFQINRTCIVNIRKIKHIKGKQHSVIIGDQELLVSKRLWKAFVEKYNLIRYYNG